MKRRATFIDPHGYITKAFPALIVGNLAISAVLITIMVVNR